MMRPMPFWPSFEPCAKLTPVQVRTAAPGPATAAADRPAVFKERRVFDENFRQQQQAAGYEKTDQRRDEQGHDRVLHLAIHAVAEYVTGREQGVHQAHAHDRADERVRTRRRQTAPPHADVPDDGRNQHREYHRVARARTTMDHQFTGSKATMPNATAPLKTRTPVRFISPDQMTAGVAGNVLDVDRGRYRFGRVVKAVTAQTRSRTRAKAQASAR